MMAGGGFFHHLTPLQKGAFLRTIGPRCPMRNTHDAPSPHSLFPSHYLYNPGYLKRKLYLSMKSVAQYGKMRSLKETLSDFENWMQGLVKYIPLFLPHADLD